MKAQWLERRSGNFPCSLTSIQLSLYQKINHTDSYSPPNKEVGVNQIIEILAYNGSDHALLTSIISPPFLSSYYAWVFTWRSPPALSLIVWSKWSPAASCICCYQKHSIVSENSIWIIYHRENVERHNAQNSVLFWHLRQRFESCTRDLPAQEKGLLLPCLFYTSYCLILWARVFLAHSKLTR